jgi:hypothetical protein
MVCKVYHDIQDRHRQSKRLTKLTFRVQGDRFWVCVLQHQIVICRLHRKQPLTSLDQNLERTPTALLLSHFFASFEISPFFPCLYACLFSRSSNLEVIRINRGLLRSQHYDSKLFHVKSPLTGEVQSIDLRPGPKEGKYADEAFTSESLSTLAWKPVAKRCYPECFHSVRYRKADL